MNEETLKSIFGKFAGKEIPVEEKEHDYKGTKYTQPMISNGDSNPTLKELNEVAKKHGMVVRVWLPNTVGTMDYRTDRLNVFINKAADGKWRITKGFGIG